MGNGWTLGRSEAWTWKAGLLVLPVPLSSFPVALSRLTAKGAACLMVVMAAKKRVAPSSWSGGPLRKGAQGRGEGLSQGWKPSWHFWHLMYRPQFLLLSYSAPPPWLSTGPALHYCSESCFINRRILNTEPGIKQRGWLWAAVFYK